MNNEVLMKVKNAQVRTDLPKFNVGDTIAVHTIIRDKGKQRIQVFKGIVIAVKGTQPSKTFTIRKISSGISVEKIFPINSPNIKKIEFIKKGKVRRSKLYYMRERIGKRATKIAEGELSKEEIKFLEEMEQRSKEQAKDLEDSNTSGDSEQKEETKDKEEKKKTKEEGKEKDQESNEKKDKKDEAPKSKKEDATKDTEENKKE